MMFYTFKYVSAVGDLGLDKRTVDSFWLDAMQSMGELCRKLGLSPKEAAIEAFIMVAEQEYILDKEKYKPIVMSAGKRISKWGSNGDIQRHYSDKALELVQQLVES